MIKGTTHNDMNIKKLEYFLSVAELLNFTRAAERHFISQTAMSQQIAALESELGVQLFTRDTKTVVLTDAGHCLAREAKVLLADYRHLCLVMEQQSRQNSALMIEYTGPIEQSLIKKAMERYSRKNEEYSVQFRYTGQSAARADLMSGACDAVVSVSDEFADDTDVSRILLARNPIKVAMNPGHPLSQKYGPVSLEELRRENIVILTPDAAQQGNAIVSGLLINELGVSESNIIQVENIETQLLQISLGQGVSLLPVTKEILDYGIAFMPLSGKPLWHEIYFLYCRKTPLLSSFMSELSDQKWEI